MSPTRKIGDTVVSAIGYGAMAYGPSTQTLEERLDFLDAVHASGCTFWDTADVYGDSETLIGKWFERSGKRSDIFLATKFGFNHKDGLSGIVKGDPEYVSEAFNESLSKLGVDYVDLYYLHRADKNVPIELTVREMAKLVKAGKVKYLGLSEVSAETLRRAHAVHPISAVEVEYSPFTLDIEDPKIGLLEACHELGITIVAYSPLGRGLLTGRFKSPDDFEKTDWRALIPRYSKENFPNILKLADGLKEIGERHGGSAGQAALAWILAQGDDIIPIPGTGKIANLKDNLGALKFNLSLEEEQEVRRIAKIADAVHGDRYFPATMAENLFANTPPLNE